MHLTRRTLASATVSGVLAASTRTVRAQAPTIRLGLLTDLSGNNRDTGGLSSVACAR